MCNTGPRFEQRFRPAKWEIWRHDCAGKAVGDSAAADSRAIGGTGVGEHFRPCEDIVSELSLQPAPVFIKTVSAVRVW